MHNVSHETPGFVSKKLPELEFWFHHQNPSKNGTKKRFPPETSSTLSGKSKVSHETSSFRTSDGKKNSLFRLYPPTLGGYKPNELVGVTPFTKGAQNSSPSSLFFKGLDEAKCLWVNSMSQNSNSGRVFQKIERFGRRLGWLVFTKSIKKSRFLRGGKAKSAKFRCRSTRTSRAKCLFFKKVSYCRFFGVGFRGGVLRLAVW